MRTIISIAIAVVLFIFLGYLAYSGSIVWTDYWTTLAVTLTAIALGILYWGFKPKIDRFFEERKETEKSRAETVPSLEIEKRKNELLLDNTQITKLNVNDSLLDKIYEQAQRIAIDLYHDAQLSSFTIQVYPYEKTGPQVNIYMDFYSKWADKICGFQHRGSSEQLKHITPDKAPISNSERIVSATLLWKTCPQWMQFLDRAYIKIKPLTPNEKTSYHLRATSPTDWYLNFEDGFSGKEHSFRWNGKGLDEKSVKQVK